jgi:hypothetical protein
MKSRFTAVSVAGAAALCSILVFAVPAVAETIVWNQRAVTAIAAKLAKSVMDVHCEVKKDPSAQLGSPTRRAQYQAREDLKLLVNVSKRLAAQLAAGEDRDATLPTFTRLQMIRRDAEETGRKAHILAPDLEKVASAQALLDQLAPYYEDGPPAGASSATTK